MSDTNTDTTTQQFDTKMYSLSANEYTAVHEYLQQLNQFIIASAQYKDAISNVQQLNIPMIDNICYTDEYETISVKDMLKQTQQTIENMTNKLLHHQSTLSTCLNISKVLNSGVITDTYRNKYEETIVKVVDYLHKHFITEEPDDNSYYKNKGCESYYTPLNVHKFKTPTFEQEHLKKNGYYLAEYDKPHRPDMGFNVYRLPTDPETIQRIIVTHSYWYNTGAIFKYDYETASFTLVKLYRTSVTGRGSYNTSGKEDSISIPLVEGVKEVLEICNFVLYDGSSRSGTDIISKYLGSTK